MFVRTALPCCRRQHAPRARHLDRLRLAIRRDERYLPAEVDAYRGARIARTVRGGGNERLCQRERIRHQRRPDLSHATGDERHLEVVLLRLGEAAVQVWIEQHDGIEGAALRGTLHAGEIRADAHASGAVVSDGHGGELGGAPRVGGDAPRDGPRMGHYARTQRHARRQRESVGLQCTARARGFL